jgi:hypothetical protein
MSTKTNPVSYRWRRYARFSVRGMTVSVLLIGIGLGWMVRSIRSAQIQRDAVVAITNAGGFVRYDWEWPAGEHWAPRWLVDLVGASYFGNVIAVEFDPASTATDETFEHVGRLTELRGLDLRKLNVSDAELAHLKGLTKLSRLRLMSTDASEAGVKRLETALPRLKVRREWPVRGCE